MSEKKAIQIKKFKNTKLSIVDKQLLHAIEPVAEAIAKMFGNNCEVVLHSIEDWGHSIIKIENGYVTGRTIGAPLTDFAIEVLKNSDSLKSDVTEVYYSKTNDGEKIRSVTALLRNGTGKPIGFLCINFNISVSLIDLINESSSTQKTKHDAVHENFVLNTEDLIKKSLDEATLLATKKKGVPPIERNKSIVLQLFKKGIFDIKGAVELVANELGGFQVHCVQLHQRSKSETRISFVAEI